MTDGESTNRRRFDVVVIGGGINGLSAVYHLLRLGARNVALVEQFALGHDRGSSHGLTRITRSAYHAADYAALMRRVFNEEMPRWERDLGGPLSIPTPGCFFGPNDGDYPKYRASVAGFDCVDEIDPAEARRRFPQMTFADADSVIVDSSCAALKAEEIIRRLIGHAGSNGATLLERTAVRRIEVGRSPIRLILDEGELLADRVIVTAGGWIGRLTPRLASSLTVVRQTVGYFKFGSPQARRVERAPVWVYVGRAGDDYYGLPALGDEGVKLARHRRSGEPDDPDQRPDRPDPEEIARLIAFADRHFSAPRLEEPNIDFCLYTNTADEDFIIDRHPDDPNVQLGSACSGHGFKFGPLTGRALAERALLGRSFLDDEPALVRRFSLDKSRDF
jgi:sarcosine oxidase